MDRRFGQKLPSVHDLGLWDRDPFLELKNFKSSTSNPRPGYPLPASPAPPFGIPNSSAIPNPSGPKQPHPDSRAVYRENTQPTGIPTPTGEIPVYQLTRRDHIAKNVRKSDEGLLIDLPGGKSTVISYKMIADVLKDPHSTSTLPPDHPLKMLTDALNDPSKPLPPQLECQVEKILQFANHAPSSVKQQQASYAQLPHESETRMRTSSLHGLRRTPSSLLMPPPDMDTYLAARQSRSRIPASAANAPPSLSSSQRADRRGSMSTLLNPAVEHPSVFADYCEIFDDPRTTSAAASPPSHSSRAAAPSHTHQSHMPAVAGSSKRPLAPERMEKSMREHSYRSASPGPSHGYVHYPKEYSRAPSPPPHAGPPPGHPLHASHSRGYSDHYDHTQSLRRVRSSTFSEENYYQREYYDPRDQRDPREAYYQLPPGGPVSSRPSSPGNLSRRPSGQWRR